MPWDFEWFWVAQQLTYFCEKIFNWFILILCLAVVGVHLNRIGFHRPAYTIRKDRSRSFVGTVHFQGTISSVSRQDVSEGRLAYRL